MSSAAISATGDQVLPSRWLTGLELVRQRLAVRLSTVRGTWPDDETVGLPFDRWIERPAQVTPAIVAAAYRAQLLADPAVQSIRTLTAAASGRTITLTAEVEVRQDGQTGTLSLTLDPLLRTGAAPMISVMGRAPGRVVS
jgi:hypothetical protein